MVHQRNNSHGLKLNLMQSLFFDPEKGKRIKKHIFTCLIIEFQPEKMQARLISGYLNI